MLSQVCALQKQYGKTQAELETLVEGFHWLLSDYHIADIKTAFREYMLEHSDIPAPADIKKIIEKLIEEPGSGFSLETLQRFKNKGIPLSQAQNDRLADFIAIKRIEA